MIAVVANRLDKLHQQEFYGVVSQHKGPKMAERLNWKIYNLLDDDLF